MNTDTNPRIGPGTAQAASVSPRTLTTPHLEPKYFGLAFGATCLVFYLGFMLTMAAVPHGATMIFFNSLHDLDVEPVLKTSVPFTQVALGMVATFILGWFVGVLMAGIYKLSLRTGK